MGLARNREGLDGEGYNRKGYRRDYMEDDNEGGNVLAINNNEMNYARRQ